MAALVNQDLGERRFQCRSHERRGHDNSRRPSKGNKRISHRFEPESRAKKSSGWAFERQHRWSPRTCGGPSASRTTNGEHAPDQGYGGLRVALITSTRFEPRPRCAAAVLASGDDAAGRNRRPGCDPLLQARSARPDRRNVQTRARLGWCEKPTLLRVHVVSALAGAGLHPHGSSRPPECEARVDQRRRRAPAASSTWDQQGCPEKGKLHACGPDQASRLVE